MNAKIIIATHKMYDMPQDDIYLPVHVGREGKDTGRGKIWTVIILDWHITAVIFP